MTIGKDDANYSHETSTSKSPEVEEKQRVPFHKLFGFADSFDKLLMSVGTAGAIVNGVCMPLMTILVGNVIDSFGRNKNNKDVVHGVSKVCLEFVFLGVATFAAAFFQVTCWMITGERQAARIRGLYLETILRQDIAFFEVETNTGEVVGRMSGDIVHIQNAMGEKVGKFIQLIASFIGGFVIAFVKGWLLSLVMLSCLPPLVAAGGSVTLIISRAASRGQHLYAKAANVVDQTVGSIRTVASFTGEAQAVRSYNKFLGSAYKSGVRERLAAGFGLGVVYLVVFCSYALAVWFGARLILEKGYTGGTVINVIFAVMTGSLSLGQASPCLSSFASGQAAAHKMFQTIQRKPLIDAYDTKGETLEDIHGDIELRNVSFSYPARPDERILSGFSLFILNGTTAALVGQSGSGKSTVISLIERFYDPQDGAVLIDGVDLKAFHLKWIRSKIGLVSQEPVLFTSSIKENIAYGKENATIEEIRSAAEVANAAKFIEELPKGLDTMVGEHGTQLSGGQKQRIAIARAIVKDPRILLLDEATSALDAESERMVQEALDRIMGNLTTVVVAHRLSTVRNADMIAVIHQGKIVEEGSHLELLQDPEGAYTRLIRLQESENTKQEERNPIGSKSFRNSLTSKQSLIQTKSSGSSFENSRSHKSFPVTGSRERINLPNVENNQEGDPLPQDQAPKVSLLRIAALNKPEIPVLLLGTLAGAANGVIFPIFGVLTASAIKAYYEPPHELKSDSRFWGFIFTVLGMGSLLASPVKSYLFGVAENKLVQRIRSMCFEKVVYMEVSWFDDPKHSSGAIGARLSADASMITGLVGEALVLAVQNVSAAIFSLIIGFAANWQLSFVVSAMLPLIIINGYAEIKFLEGFSADGKIVYAEASQIANEAVSGIKTIASFCAEEKVMQTYKKKCEASMKNEIRRGFVSGLGFGLSFFFVFAVYAVSFYTGARFIVDGKATFDDVFLVFFALTMAATGISQTSSFAPDWSKAKMAAMSIFAILDGKSKIDPRDEAGIILENVRGDVEFHRITFRYPIRPDIQIFQDLSLRIHAGKTVALVGESGSGKSTVVSLLQRFYDPDSGHITLDGVEICKLQLKWLRQQMGLVEQEPVLFNDTIRANIAYGKGGNATEAEIVMAAELANAHNFISSLKYGYGTVVGERGTQLSGGQKQRVALARAIIKNPKILLLDEATSALDAEAERVFQEALDRVMVNRSTVVVAHRLSTIRNADVIAVLKNGMIVEEGKHETLIAIEGGVYASLVQLHTSGAS